MEDNELQDIPLQGRLIIQKLIKNGMKIEELIQNIRRCVDTKREIMKMHFEARKSIQGMKNDLEVLNNVKEQEDEEETKINIERMIHSHKKLLITLQIDLRKANLIAEEKLSSSEREELFTMNKENADLTNLRRRTHSKEKAAKATSNITSNLVKIAEMMSTQVAHGEESAKTLEESSKQLVETQEEFKGMAGVIQMSKKLINKYNRRELTDTLLIFFGLILFFSTVIYIVLKRI